MIWAILILAAIGWVFILKGEKADDPMPVGKWVMRLVKGHR